MDNLLNSIKLLKHNTITLINNNKTIKNLFTVNGGSHKAQSYYINNQIFKSPTVTDNTNID